jgi:anaerobic ribonucleoside-triphosphate reductase activating protein
MQINISRAHFPVTTLGPGRRVGISVLLTDLALWLSECDGVTISGGEPFDQYDALRELLRLIKSCYDKDVLVFSGYALEDIEPRLTSLTDLVDAVVSDPFDLGAPQTLALRGSDNQRLTLLTLRGQARFAAYQQAAVPPPRRLDVMFARDGVTWMAGIPRGDDVLAKAGHQILTTRSKRGRNE